MLRRDQVSKMIDKLIALEMRLVPLFESHISSSLFFSKLPAAEKEALLEKLKEKAATQSKHIKMLNDIKDEITKNGSDVY
jgi:hypothetical protein